MLQGPSGHLLVDKIREVEPSDDLERFLNLPVLISGSKVQFASQHVDFGKSQAGTPWEYPRPRWRIQGLPGFYYF